MFTQGRFRNFAICIADLLCVAAVWTVVVFGFEAVNLLLDPNYTYGPAGARIFLNLWPLGVMFVVLNAALGLYHGNWTYPAAPFSPVEEFRRLICSAAVVHLGVIAALGLVQGKTEGYSRWVIGCSGIVSAFAAQSFRNWMRAALYRLGWGQIPVVLAGGGAVARRVAVLLADNAYVGMRIVGYFNGAEKRKGVPGGVHAPADDRSLDDLGLPYLGTLRDIVPVSRKRDVKILLACQDDRFFRVQMDEFTGWFTYIEYLPTTRTFPVFGSRAVVFDGVGGLEMMNQSRMKAKRIQKRLLDFALAAVAFVCLSPFFIVLPLLIKLTSRGPVFYRQERLGLDGRTIRVWKFRSMYADADERLKKLLASDPAIAAEWDANFKLARDPRVTPFGRFLRKTSLDELPQLFNVFAGDMALIGPRPIVADEVAYYGDAYRVFSSVRPGVTGLWQVSGRSNTDYARRVALDTYYVLNWSLWMDVWILVRTVYAVLLMRGAC